MSLTRDFKKAVFARVECDPDIPKALMDEAAISWSHTEASQSGHQGPYG